MSKPTPIQASPSRKARISHHILGVGIAALDIINQVPRYPAEDEEIRTTQQRILRGGNAANTLSVLRQFGHRCDWVGCYGDDASATLVLDDLHDRGIGTANAVCIPQGATPTSYIVLSEANASRTIVHHRQLPELTAVEFAEVPLAEYDWVHFEGRHPAETALMVERVRRERPDLQISIEMEKPRPQLNRLLLPVEVLVFSRVYVQSQGCIDHQPWDFLADQQRASDAALCIAPWGATGAFGLDQQGRRLFAAAHPPEELRDTIGAGDVFNAALIDALLRKQPVDVAMERANRIAGFKCGAIGLDGLIAAANRAGLP